MTSFTKLIRFAWPLLLLCLTAIAGYAYSQIRYLSLPIPEALALFTVVLPLITGISTEGVYGLIQRSSKNQQYQLTIPLSGVIGFQLIYETIVATLSLTHILPPSSLQCGLLDRWQKLFSAKNGPAVRTIQDAFDCCGFNSVQHMAYPFGKGPSACAETYNRTSRCLEPWREAEQVNAGLLLLVASILFIVKVLSILSLLTNSSWSRAAWMQQLKQGNDAENPEEDPRASVRRLIEENANNEGYHDEPDQPLERTQEGAPSRGDQGLRVEPSPLTEHGNEWRNEGQ